MKNMLIALSIALMAIVQPAFAAERASPEEAKAMALKAAAYVQDHGREAAVEAFMSPDGEWLDRDLYVFMYDADGITLALAPAPDLVGTNRLDLQGYGGTYIIKEMLAVESEGWVSYLYDNPVTQQVEAKTSYIIRMDGGGFVGVGAYKE
ncbi:hypothetical protein GCM10007160_40260 [Litchfieldella qijiaojingensis]|uniref:Single Cache domain-containing protein n=1 Tax=Litchfieldella qijiaojingensis TaxID=980347 RepID=A0ABQ2Z8Z3_9GAMM|nr:cache domain-containing protein [Halomonas qijiaojingensis]GGY08845.1 hypothetical protein GCM10007160_40260 [Halomonas qijiaojingensis]